jgi:ketosteroid isomerase-like protein
VSRLERLADILAIQEINNSFAYHLDRNEIEPLVALFAPDARRSNGPRVSRGRAEIEAFYKSRTAHGVRTARHMYSGLRIVFEGETRARATSVWLSFAQNSAPPVDYSVPYLVADFEDVYERDADGEWRILSWHIRPIFRDPIGVPPDTEAPAAASPAGKIKCPALSAHARWQVDDGPIHGERAVSAMMQGLGILLPRIDPRREDLEDEQVVPAHQRAVDRPAFEVGEALDDQGRRDALGGCDRQPECREFVDIAPGGVADLHDLPCQSPGRDCDHALARRTQGGEAVVGLAHDAGDARRLELDHHVPRHRHDVGAAAFAPGREQHHGPRLDERVDLAQGKGRHRPRL